MERHELTELHFIAPIGNLSSIMAHGILCHRRMATLPHASIAMAEVQDRRRIKRVPQGKPLHEYANLYVNGRNPMLYKRLSQRHEICVLSVSTDVLDIPGAVVTDQNAASDYVRFAAAPAGLSIVNRAATFAESWKHPEDQIAEWRHKAQMCAEVLVPDGTPATYIKGAYVASPKARDAVNALNIGIAVRINNRLFFG